MEIPEILLERKDEDKKPFKWASADVGFRNKIGGNPTNLHENDFPKCPDCGKPMTFYGQLDSLNDDIIIADCGIVAVFICFDCLTTESLITSG